MTTLHEPRRTDPGPPHDRDLTPWLILAGVVVLVGVLSVTLGLVLRGHAGDLLAGPGAVRGSGVAASEARTLPSFTAVVLAGSNDVTVRVGAPQSVVVHADDNLLGHVRTTVRSGALVIETAGRFATRAPMRVSVVVPKITGVTLTGSGTMLVEGVDAASFSASLPGSGTMQVSGRTEHLTADLSGSGRMDMHGLIARAVEVQLSGSGEVQVHATDSIDAEVSGSGSVRYAGDPPHVTRTVTGSGAIEPE
jgi:hypothetical protein